MDPGFGQGRGPRNFVGDFADVAKWHRVTESSQYWPGSSCIFNCQICILPLFLVFFLQTLTVALCEYTTKYLLKYEKFWPFLKNTILLFFIWENQGSYLFIWFSKQMLCMLCHLRFFSFVCEFPLSDFQSLILGDSDKFICLHLTLILHIFQLNHK